MQLASRRLYLFAMIIVPLFGAFFFDSLLSKGVPGDVPIAVVDLDHSEMSRSMTRALDVQEVIDVRLKAESFSDAMTAVKSGEIFGFYVIPADFEQDVFAGRKPTLNYYSNMTYFVPGTFTYKGFKTIAVSTAAGVVKARAESMGLPDDIIAPLTQPVNINIQQIGNPWTNYSYYLGPSFSYGIIELMILLVTVFSITAEIKNGTSRRWLATGGDSIIVAVFGKLVPQTVIFTLVGWAVMAMQFGFSHFPLNSSLGVMLGAMFLFVLASQSLGLFIASAIPNPRLGLSAVSLLGILAFSVAGFSFPVESMYGAIGVFAYILPVRWMFLIYVNEALNGVDIYFSRTFFVALILFIPAGTLLLWNLKRACRKCIYIP